MSAAPVDYAALAEQARQSAPVDYAALAEQARNGDTKSDSKPADVPWYKRATKVALAPIMDTLGGDNLTARALLQAATNDPNLYDNIRAAQSQGPSAEDSKSPLKYALKQGVGGMVADTADTAASFTSPTSIALMGAGAATKLPGAAATLGKVALRTAAPVAVGAGAKQVYDAGTANTPEAWQQRLMGGAMAAGGGAGVAEALNAAPNVSLRGALAKRMAEKPAGEQFTRQEVLDAARANGVNLDLADATGSPIARTVKKATQHTLAGNNAYEANVTKNVTALEQWADAEAGKYAPEGSSREVIGPQIQQKLQQDLAEKKANASEMFSDLDKRLGKAPIDQTPLRNEAQSIIKEYSPYYDRHPELLPKQAWAILNDLSKEPTSGSPQYSLGELHQLRSDLQDFYRNTPDLIKGKSQSWIQRMVSNIDQTMTGAEKVMQPMDVAEFRKANDIWGGIKNTYDNPSSPLYHAVRSQFPSQVSGMLTKPTPELAAQVRQTLGSLEGPFQRQFVENLLNDKSGALDLKNLNSRLSRVPDDFLHSMLGKDGAKNLRLLGKVAQRVTADVNPSGTAKVGIPAAEVVNAFTNPIAGAAEIGGTYAASKAMTSPRVVDFMTMPAKQALKMSPRAVKK